MAINLEPDQELRYDEETGEWILRTYQSPKETIAFNEKSGKEYILLLQAGIYVLYKF